MGHPLLFGLQGCEDTNFDCEQNSFEKRKEMHPEAGNFAD
jgi:hypothetical protein